MKNIKNLYEIFPNWEAYRNGPVAVEPYQIFQDMPTLIGGYRADNVLADDEACKAMIDNAIDKLLENDEYRKIAEHRDKLVELSHSGYLWKLACPLWNRKLQIEDKVGLKIEKRRFDAKLQEMSK